MNEINGCEVCGARALHPVLDLGEHPLCDDLVPIGRNEKCREYPIDIVYCTTCFTAHQRYQVPKQTLFPQTYHYRARVTGSVLQGMAGLVASCAQRFGDLSGKVVLDVGCNDGSLLNYFRERGCKTIGVEPTGAAADSSHQTLNTFFDDASAAEVLRLVGKPDIITFTNVFAHIEDLPALLRNVGSLMHAGTKLVVENHYLGDILKRGQFDTFYHEHPRSYSARSFQYIAKSLGVELIDLEFVSRYGGNIRAYLAAGTPTTAVPDETGFEAKFADMAADVEDWKTRMRTLIEEHVSRHGKLRAKAFPGRAAILIKLLGVDERHISAVYEIKGSIKTGNYVPGTRIPILPEAELFAEPDQNQPILNLAWHIPAEVRANLAAHNYTGKVIDIK